MLASEILEKTKIGDKIFVIKIITKSIIRDT